MRSLNFPDFEQKIYGRIVKPAFYVSKENNFEHFLLKASYFTFFFGILRETFSDCCGKNDSFVKTEITCPKESFLWKMTSFRELWAKTFRCLGKKLCGFSELNSRCLVKTNLRKKYEFVFWLLALNLGRALKLQMITYLGGHCRKKWRKNSSIVTEKLSNCGGKLFSRLIRTAFYVFRRNTWGKQPSGKILQWFYFLTTQWEIVVTLSGEKSEGLPKLHFTCPEKCFWEKRLTKNKLKIFGEYLENFQTLEEKTSTVSSKLHSTCPGEHFSENIK